MTTKDNITNKNNIQKQKNNHRTHNIFKKGFKHKENRQRRGIAKQKTENKNKDTQGQQKDTHMKTNGQIDKHKKQYTKDDNKTTTNT